jgi:EAL domain
VRSRPIRRLRTAPSARGWRAYCAGCSSPAPCSRWSGSCCRPTSAPTARSSSSSPSPSRSPRPPWFCSHGGGYYLKYLPVDFLKIDGDFITSLSRNRTDQAVVKAIVELSSSLGKKTIAEFVGDDRTLELLRAEGVDFAQGFHVGRPFPVSEMWTVESLRDAAPLGVGAD